MLYFIFKKALKVPLWAFLSATLFIIMPSFSMEVPMIPRQAYSEPFFILAIWILIDKDLIKNQWTKYLLLGSSILMAIMGHYSLGYIMVGILAAYIIIVFLYQLVTKSKVTPLLPLILILILTTALGVAYFHEVAGGIVLDQMGGVVGQVLGNPIGTPGATSIVSGTGDLIASGGASLLQVGLGADFLDASPAGKAFRTFQILLEFTLALGSLIIVLRKSLPTTYRAVALTMCFILVGCIVFPILSQTLNASRFLHIVLIALAPAPIVCLTWKLRRWAPKLMICLLIPYLFLTSGWVFEAIKHTDISALDVPYSYALSGGRLGVLGDYTKDDYSMRDYVTSNFPNTINPIYGDLPATAFLSETLGPSDDLRQLWGRAGTLVYSITDDTIYLYLRSWNVENQKMVLWSQIGSRMVIPLDIYLAGCNTTIVKKIGNAELLEVSR
jgi:uncharacterized membrane protein